MNRCGIIGGMGPLATLKLFERIIDKTKAECDQDHIDLMISNHASLPDRTEIILNKEDGRFLQAIKKDFYWMEASEVDIIAIPCNTSHYFFNEFLKMTEIPIINMVEETVKLLLKPSVIMGTKGTIQAGVYEYYGKIHEKEIIPLDPGDDVQIMEIIYDVKENLTTKSPQFEKLIRKYQIRGVHSVLACTELSCIELPKDLKRSTIDAMDVLVHRIIKSVGKESIEIER